MTGASVSDADITVVLQLRAGLRTWRAPFASLRFDDSPGSPWLLVTPEVRDAFDAVTRAGRPLAQSCFGPPLLGVKCGCNEAFIVTNLDQATGSQDGDARDQLVAIRTASRAQPIREGLIERAMLRPAVRGESIRPWRISTIDFIIWTHGHSASDVNTPLHALPTHAAAWLTRWRRQLAVRSDMGARSAWWSLFRTPSARSSAARVVWSDLGRRPRAAVLTAGDPSVPLNSCYVAAAPDAVDAYTLAALLNSAVAAAWLNVIAEPAANDYRRYLGWTVGLLPLPTDWARTRALLGPIGRDAVAGKAPEDSALTMAVADAYGLPIDRLQPLLAWTTW